jgi:hypothetical protein
MIRTCEPTRRRLAQLIVRLPRGSKTQFAMVCGFKRMKHLRNVATGIAFLTPRVAHRLERLMDAVERGSLVPVEGPPRRGPKPHLVWQWR